MAPPELNTNPDSMRHLSFMHDLLVYAFNEFGIEWSWPELTKMAAYKNNKRFQSNIGKSVIHYLKQHERELQSYITHYVSSVEEIEGNLVDVLLWIADDVFQEKNFIKEYFLYSTHIVQMAFMFHYDEQRESIIEILEDLELVYECHLSKKMQPIGGFYALYKYAVRRMLYEE